MIERISAYHKKFFGGFEELTFCFSSTYEYLFCENDNGFEKGVLSIETRVANARQSILETFEDE